MKKKEKEAQHESRTDENKRKISDVKQQAPTEKGDEELESLLLGSAKKVKEAEVTRPKPTASVGPAEQSSAREPEDKTEETRPKPKAEGKAEEKIELANVKVLDSYDITADKLPLKVNIIRDPKDFVMIYKVELPKLEPATRILMDDIRERLIEKVKVEVEEIVDPKAFASLKDRYRSSADSIIAEEFPQIAAETKNILVSYLMNNMLGLGELEPLLADNELEELVINTSDEPAWVYHKKHGWLKTTIQPENEAQIHNFASVIGRRVGREITNLTPLMDARLTTGDRVNATLFPISSQGNTITIRKFARTPWTVVDFIDPKINSLNTKVASLLWMAIQNELNIIIAGGTGSGKTSMLNALTPFIPPNQRIISIEDTRELQLPKFLHWVPMVTRSPNPEGKGEVTMLQLMINSLRMRPDRIIVGEVRRSKEAEVLFEAMHTGHSVYSTLHADTVAQTYRRLVNPPINIPVEMLESLHLILVQFRQRRLNIRRTFQVAEIELPEEAAGELKIKFNLLYKWNAKNDQIDPVNPSTRVIDELTVRGGMGIKEIEKDLQEKEGILKWMLSKNVRDINEVGKIVSTYYTHEDFVLDAVKKNLEPKRVLEK